MPAWRARNETCFSFGVFGSDRVEVDMERNRWQDWAMLVLGAWLVVSPFWMDAYASVSSVAAWNAYVLGALVIAMSWAALVRPQRWEEWLNLAAGIWLIIAPFLLGFFATESGAAWNQIVVGVLVGIDAISLLALRRRERGGHVRT